MFLPLRVTCLRTVNPSGSLMTISNRRIEPALSYILSQLLFHSMFVPGSWNAFEREIANIADDFAFNGGTDVSSKKAHDFLGAKEKRAVIQQSRVKLA